MDIQQNTFFLKQLKALGLSLGAILLLAACQGEKNNVDGTHTVDKPAAQTTGAEAQTQTDQALDIRKPSEQTDIANTDINDQEAEDIVESIGFAEAEDIPEPTSGTKAYKAFCNSIAVEPPESDDQTKQCKKISNRLASVSQKNCMSSMLSRTGCESIDGTPLLLREFPPLEGKDSLGKVLIIGGIHGDELTSVSVVFRWIAKLNKYHSGLFHWHIMPVMNPDGLLQRSASRTNRNGIDLNRNLPSDDWEKNALSYWKSKGGSNPRRYPGERPASEPESQWLVDEINLFKPDAIISVHAPYGVVDFDAQLLNTAPKSLGKLHLNLLGTYPGSLGNYAGINRNIPVITLELPHSWEMPSEADTDRIWTDIVRWLKKNLGAKNSQ